MSSSDALLANATVYSLWQAPFREAKLAPCLASGDFTRAERVLDVACGPGTNARHFRHADYTGFDANPGYVKHARSRFPFGRFLTGDATEAPLPANEPPFDLILVNSFLHHLDESGASRVLENLSRWLKVDGSVHVLDLVLPERASVARWLARADRGGHARPVETWRALLTEFFEPVTFEPYAIRALGLPLWHMVYFKGRARREP